MDCGKLIFLLPFVNGVFAMLVMIPARTQVTYYNPLYVTFANASTHRHGRRGAVVTDIYGISRHSWGNNITVLVVFYEFLSNEYKRSFFEMKVKLCDYLLKDPFIAPIVRNTFFGKHHSCPYPAGEWKITNMTVEAENVPANFPFRHGRMNLDVVLTAAKTTVLVTAQTYLEIKEIGKKRGK